MMIERKIRDAYRRSGSIRPAGGGGNTVLISLVEYAQRHGKDPATARQMALRGGFKTARKIGRNWVIEDSEPWPDRRVKTGRYVKEARPSGDG